MDISLSSIDWGPDEAKGDEKLGEYFVEVPEYKKILTGQYRYIIGRKGTGKTAICESIRLRADSLPTTFATKLSLKNFPLNTLTAMKDSSFTHKSQFVPVWSFLIVVEISRLVLKDNGSGPSWAVEGLAKFLAQNFSENNLGFIETLKTLRKRSKKLEISMSWFKGEAGKEAGSEALVSVHYQKITDHILANLSQISSESTYHLLVDELDEGYRADDKTIHFILLALLRANEDIYLALKYSGISFFPVVVLRSDIFARLEDNDLNKLDEALMHLRWSSKVGAYNLQEIIAARIRASFPDKSISKPWSGIVDLHATQALGGPDKLWYFMADRTFDRPRDILKMVKECSKVSSQLLGFDVVKNAEAAYSFWLYKEVKDEIQSHLEVWQDALSCIKNIGRPFFEASHLIRELSTDRTIRKWFQRTGANAEDICKILFDFSIIGNVDDVGRRLFKYQDEDRSWNPRFGITVHLGLHASFHLGSHTQGKGDGAL